MSTMPAAPEFNPINPPASSFKIATSNTTTIAISMPPWVPAASKSSPIPTAPLPKTRSPNNEGTGLWADTDLSGSTLTFSDNFVHGNIAKPVDYLNVTQSGIWSEAGIKVEVSEDVDVYNNIVTGNGGNGILVAGAQNTIVQNNTVTNNFGLAAIGPDHRR